MYNKALKYLHNFAKPFLSHM